MNDTNPLRPRPPALPDTIADLMAARKVQGTKTLNDHVEELHQELWSDAEYKRFNDAVYDEDAVEGSTEADDLLAAKMIRDLASQRGKSYVAGKKLATLKKALGVVLRRYGISRNDRRNMMHGEVGPAN